MNDYENKIHKWGRLSTSMAIVLFLSFPLFISIYYNAWPGWGPFLSGLLGIAPIFWVVGAIEAFTFGPMLGSGGSYLGFVTGNLTNLKVPAALNAMQSMEVEANSEEGDVVCTIAVAVSSIVTTIILVIGMLLLAPLQPILQSAILSPAFDNILPALFGALAVVFISKNWKIAISPMLLMLILFITVPSLASAVSILVPVGAIFTIIISRILYKKGLLG
jgi:hypothetical protein